MGRYLALGLGLCYLGKQNRWRRFWPHSKSAQSHFARLQTFWSKCAPTPELAMCSKFSSFCTSAPSHLRRKTRRTKRKFLMIKKTRKKIKRRRRRRRKTQSCRVRLPLSLVLH